MTQGTMIPPDVDAEAIEYGHVYANYVKSVADTPADDDANPDIVHVNGQVTFESTFPGSSARGSIRLPAEPRAYGLIVTGDTFEVVNSRLVDHEGREGVRLIAAVDGMPISWQAVVTLQDSAGRTIYNKAYIVHYDLWANDAGELSINLPDLIPNPGRLEPPEGAAIRQAEKALEEIRVLGESNIQIHADVEGLKSDIIVLHGETGQRLTAAEAARDAAVVARNAAQAARGEAQTARTDAQAARTQAGTSRDEALAYRNTALEHRNDALAYRNTALEHRNDANTSKLAAGESETNAKQSEINAAEHERRAGVERNLAEQISTAVFTRAAELDQDLEAWDETFNLTLAHFGNLASDIEAIANDVAIDANRAEDAAQQAEDALTVVRAHRWVPQGEWEDNLDYSAGDVVAHDGGSYYAQEDIPAGTEPPGGNWMVLGQGGITDASELTGELTEYVDSSRATIDLGSYVPGVAPELQAAQLVAILGHLYLSLESSVEASRVTGALTDQVDASEAMVPDPSKDFTTRYPLGTFVQQMVEGVNNLFAAWEDKADVGHTHTTVDVDGLQAALDETTDASRLEGALTDQVDLTHAVSDYARMDGWDGQGPPPMAGEAVPVSWLLGTAMDAAGQLAYIEQLTEMFVGALINMDTGEIIHTHAISDVDGLQAALDDKADTDHTHTPAEVGAEPAAWTGTQAQYDALGTTDPNRTYYVVES